MIRDGQLYSEPAYVTNVITEDALQYLDAQAGRAEPFYLSVRYTAPHSPWTGHPQEIVDSYDDCAFASCPQEPRHPWAIWLTDENLGNREWLKGYFAAVTAMDADVGRIIDRVEAIACGGHPHRLGATTASRGHHGFWARARHPALHMYDNSVKCP